MYRGYMVICMVLSVTVEIISHTCSIETAELRSIGVSYYDWT